MGSFARILPKAALYIVLGLVEVAASLAFVWSSKRVVDIATGDVQSAFVAGIVLLVGVKLVQIVCSIVRGWLEGYLVVHTRNNIRAEYFEKTMRTTWNGRDSHHSGDLVNRLEGDVDIVVDFICRTLPECLITLCRLIAATVFLFLLSPALAWILVFIMPVAVVGSRLFFRKMRRLSGEIRAKESEIQSHVQENLQHRILAKVMGSTKAILVKMKLLQKESQDKTVTRLNYSAVARAFMSLGFSAGYLLAFVWGASGLKDGTVTYGLMVAFLQLVGQVQRPVADIAHHIPAFIRALASEERLMELDDLEQEPEVENIALSGAPGIKVQGLNFAYPGGAPVLENLDFDFEPGTMTVILGETGAGKSTLSRLILALITPQSGTICLYDKQKEVPAGAATRINFMYVPQGNSLLSGNIRDNLLMARPGATDEEQLDALHLAAADFVQTLPQGLDTSCSEIGGGLSEGQAQRIAIARALLRPGGVLILDEATSALDADTEQTLLSRIAERYRGTKTIICITHRPAAKDWADKTLTLK